MSATSLTHGTMCPQCHRPAMRRAFPTSPHYVTCARGHVFTVETRTVPTLASVTR